jgi:hypothetical protein
MILSPFLEQNTIKQKKQKKQKNNLSFVQKNKTVHLISLGPVAAGLFLLIRQLF